MNHAKARFPRQATPLVLVIIGLVACAFAERLGYRDMVTIAVATNAGGLALLTQRHPEGLSARKSDVPDGH